MADFSNATTPLKISGRISGAYVDEKYFSIDGVNELATLTELLEYIASNATGVSGGNLLTYDAGNLVTVTGSEGITTTKANGVVTIIIPEGGVICHGNIFIRPADAIYSNGLVTQSIKLVIDNSASSSGIHSINPTWMSLTSNGNVASGNPMTNNTAINNDRQIDEFSNNKMGWIFQQIATRSTAGGYIFF
jgi:hypothetical protein